MQITETHVGIVKLLLNHKDIDIDKGAKNEETIFYNFMRTRNARNCTDINR